MTEERQKRQTAFTVSVKDVLTGEYVRQEGWDPNYSKVPWGLKVSRCNIIGTVLGKQQNQIEVDDTTGIITIRSFEEFKPFEGLNIGDLVMIVGKVREFSGDIYISPETCVKVEKEMLAFRLKEQELLKKYYNLGRIKQEEKVKVEVEKEEVVEEVQQENPAEKVLNYIEENDKGEGVNRQEIITHFGAHMSDVFEKLINDGDVFEVTPDVFKILK